MPAETVSRPPPRIGAGAMLATARWREILILEGTPVMGVVFSVGPLTVAKVLTALLFTLSGYLLIAHVWTLNDWADGRIDELDHNKADRAHRTRGIAGSRVLYLSLLFLGVALGLAWFLPKWPWP
jgi:4-hydroxybenzoate polyprenyltransferase